MARVSRAATVMSTAAFGAAALNKARRKLLRLDEPLDGFFDYTGPARQGVDVGSARIDLPIRYYRDDCFMGVFTAAPEPVEALLPSDRLHPVTTTSGRALVAVVAWNYLETTVGPYGEVGVAVLCTLDRKLPPLAGALLESASPAFGAFVAHLPVTTRIARDSGRTVWGYPKFVADMEFERLPAYQRVRLSEGGRHILSLRVRQSGLTVRDNRPLTTFTARGDELIVTRVPSRATYQLGSGARYGDLELGDHPVAEQLRGLDLSGSPLLTRNFLLRSGILPEGTVIGSARPYDGYRGEDRESGVLLVRYDDALPLRVPDTGTTPRPRVRA